MSAWVALGTSARPPSVAAASGERVRSAALGSERRHASDLLPRLDELFSELECARRDVAVVAVGLGPGSYTGLRVGVATALGLAQGTGARLVGVPSVAALAFAALEPGEEATVLLDGRSRELYLARYRRRADDVEELLAPRVEEAGTLPAAVPAGERILGDPTVAEAAGMDPEARARLVTDRVPDAEAVLALARLRHAREGATDPGELRPLYLRPFRVR